MSDLEIAAERWEKLEHFIVCDGVAYVVPHKTLVIQFEHMMPKHFMPKDLGMLMFQAATTVQAFLENFGGCPVETIQLDKFGRALVGESFSENYGERGPVGETGALDEADGRPEDAARAGLRGNAPPFTQGKKGTA